MYDVYFLGQDRKLAERLFLLAKIATAPTKLNSWGPRQKVGGDSVFLCEKRHGAHKIKKLKAATESWRRARFCLRKKQTKNSSQRFEQPRAATES